MKPERGYLEEAREKALVLLNESKLGGTRVRVEARLQTLKSEEAIGHPERQDYPLIYGKESIVEAEVMGSRGHAMTGQPGDYTGTVREIFSLNLDLPPTEGGDWKRAVFIATLNAFLRKTGQVDNTVHCKDEEPEECAARLPDYINKRYGTPKIALVGFQPAMADHLRRHFDLRVLDLNPANIGQVKYGLTILHGRDDLVEAFGWSDIVLATGSSVVNSTMDDILKTAGSKPVIFYGATIAGIASLLGFERYCELGH